jgi:hypothetical protein
MIVNMRIVEEKNDRKRKDQFVVEYHHRLKDEENEFDVLLMKDSFDKRNQNHILISIEN